MGDLIHLAEPTLLFGHGQAVEDPRDGLTLFGPLDEGKPYGIRAGVIGTNDGIRRFKAWVERVQRPVPSENPRGRPPFPGFEAVFQIPWKPDPTIQITISQEELTECVHIDDKHQRVFRTAELFSDAITQTIREDESSVDIWFVVITDDVHKYCRPQSVVEAELQLTSQSSMSRRMAKELQSQRSLFPELDEDAAPYRYEVDFHNQLKARLLDYDAPIQIVRESTIAHREIVNSYGQPTRKLDKLESAIAWNLATTTFYKSGGRPWKIGDIRPGVCYVGLVFKCDVRGKDPRSACCAAQMFLDSGDGVVFKGAVGPWYTGKRGDFHLSRQAANDLISLAVTSYRKSKGRPPNELLIHGKVRFNDDEWLGFEDAAPNETNLVGVRIRGHRNFKLYRVGSHAVLRGIAYVQDERTAYLWTKGYIPRLRTCPSLEVPNPLLIDVCRGSASIETVLNDIMALTKLNYNACIFAIGPPVTLRFADAVGEILTAGPVQARNPLPFKYYI